MNDQIFQGATGKTAKGRVTGGSNGYEIMNHGHVPLGVDSARALSQDGSKGLIFSRPFTNFFTDQGCRFPDGFIQR
ncbi:hypothetical protein [Pseudomonas sp. FEN]|uniref:hypothetical protein n=1 Tax=Pseudomonas sp. FEN TaxID=2767468 RepID=UPI00174ABE43|nr:hypothetical protein [Pseudomonas sp. FEN]